MAGQDVSDVSDLVGRKVRCPGSIFNTPHKSYDGVVTGTPKRTTKKCYVRFDNDSTEYWFPSKDVASWVVNEEGNYNAKPNEPDVTDGVTDTSETDVTDTEAYTTEPYTTDAYTTDAPSASEFEPDSDAKLVGGPLRSRASRLVVTHGAQYGIPLAITLAVLVLAGALWFFRQLWLSEQRLAWSSLANSRTSAVPPHLQDYVKPEL